MRMLIVSITVLMSLFLCSSENPKHDIEQKIHNIENGLVEFKPGAVDTTNAGETNALSDRMAYYKIPGVSIAVINDNEVEWAKSYGVIKAGSDTPVTTETLFEAASTTKLIVAAMVLRMVEQGLLDLDEDVNKKLRSWKIPDNSFTQEKKVSLRLLLTHQAGLNRPDGGFDWEGVPTLVETLKGESPAQNPPAVVEYVPGSKWQYSNFGYLVIQLVLEDVLGKPFPEIAQETVLGPLGMESSTLTVPLSADLKKKEAVPHDVEGTAHEPVMHPTAVANGGLMTTPSDLALFTNELILTYQGHSGRILSREMVGNMMQKELDLDPSILGFPLGEGLGVLLRGAGENVAFLHPGDNYPGSSCWLVGFPGLGKGAVIMTNGAKGNLLAMEVISAITNEYGWPVD